MKLCSITDDTLYIFSLNQNTYPNILTILSNCTFYSFIKKENINDFYCCLLPMNFTLFNIPATALSQFLLLMWFFQNFLPINGTKIRIYFLQLICKTASLIYCCEKLCISDSVTIIRKCALNAICCKMF